MGVGVTIACAVGASAVGLSAICIPFVIPAFRRVCLPFVPASEIQIKNVMSLLHKCPIPVTPLIDLGSGDGRIVKFLVYLELKRRAEINIYWNCARNLIVFCLMKFGEQLASHLTPEWRKQYIRYEELKSLLYELMLDMPSGPADSRDQYVSQTDEAFFGECEEELTKINLFFSQKLAEAQGKFHELNAELSTFKESIGGFRRTPTTQTKNVRARFSNAARLTKNNKLQKEQAKTAQQLKLAFSEFYLNLVLLQNYQQLNATGFRKILKKHDKLMLNDCGLKWRKNRVEQSSFFLDPTIETLINDVETTVINDLEGGNRQAGMKRLKVPPLSEKQSAGTAFSLGMFTGIFIVLVILIIFASIDGLKGRNEPKWVAVRLFRGFLLLFLSMWFYGLNMYGWASAGVNHVLIFEVDPRNHLTYQSVMQISAFLLMLWAMAVLGYLYASWLHVPPFIFPLLLMLICVIFLLAPFKQPEQIFRRDSRFWFIKHCFNCFTAPFHFVTFADFWLGDQMNSLTTCFLDFQYFICFYATEIDYSGAQFQIRRTNVTQGEISWGYVDFETGQDMCVSSAGIRSFVSILPAMVRFLQCLRRYRDNRAWHPHLVNAGKYATTFLVIATNSLSKWWSLENSSEASPFFYIWIVSNIISFTYTFLWDIFMDWGLIDPKAPKEAPLLREEMIYGNKWYYYFAIMEDFMLRLSWVMNVSLAEAWTLHADFLVCIMAPLEVFRRFIWNYFRLENEHINNCGQFRAVRDISLKPIKKRKGDQEIISDENGGPAKNLSLALRRQSSIALSLVELGEDQE